MRRWMMCAFIALWALTAVACGEAPRAEGGLTITFFDAGSADALLIETAQSAVLVDAGLNKGGAALADQLIEQGVRALDALIITHYDKDHVGGADAVLARLPVKAVYQPDYEKQSGQRDQFIEAMDAAGVAPTTVKENLSLTIDGTVYDLDVANAADYGEDEENDFSLVIRLTYGTARALLAGDAENPRLAELLDEGDLKAGLLKVPHHGVAEKLSAAFFAAVSADLAVITSSDDEPEERETVLALQKAGSRVLLTREGAITCTTDGKTWAAP